MSSLDVQLPVEAGRGGQILWSYRWLRAGLVWLLGTEPGPLKVQ